MTLPDTIHAIGRHPRGDKPAKPGGQWFPGPADGTRAYVALDGEMMKGVRTHLKRAEALLARTLTDGSGMTADMAVARGDVRAALKLIGGE